ncbi:hypothetical protein C8Z91_04445 [Paenibacillus elgii]|uniref:Uncharacterized protein n=1 Tax=Paenibacillus elgii TaxID=189691 RepID=A0A2T6G881_9BACL|nr:hypothetical protein [Paenibacillus elgii]PUA40360.1 hypothetical protein C8Z91_04445 [Paenibacillus elgii]
MDNRSFNVSGLTGQNQNFNFGDNGKIDQKITNGSEIDIQKLFSDLHKVIEEGDADSRDKQMAQVLEENVKAGKMDTAKTIFDLLTKTVQMSAAGIAIGKAFGWI